MHEREVQRGEEHEASKRVPHANPTPQEGGEDDREELHGDREGKGERGDGSAPPHDRPNGRRERQSAEQVDVAVAGALERYERVPRVGEYPPGREPRRGEEA